MSISREKRIERAQMRVLFRVPFFAPAVAKLPVIFEKGAGDNTAHTDGKTIKMDPDFVDKLTDDQLVTLLCHEACHPMLGHVWRAPVAAKVDQESWDTWNKATDHAVNLMLKEFSALTMGKRLADPFPFPDPQDAYCADPKFAGMAEEQIFNILNNRPKSGKGGGKGKPGQGGGKGAPGSMPSFGQFTQPGKAADPAAQKHLQNDWNNTLIQAAEMAKGRGELPGGMERLVDQLVNPKVPWIEILRSWLREQCNDDYNYLKPDLAMEESGFLMPMLDDEKFGPIVFATDTSGSIDHGMLRQFQSEKQNCLDDIKPASLLDIYCDSAIHKVAEYRPGETISKEAPGGGGTSFVPVFEMVAKLPTPPRCIVYLTDLDGTFPKDPQVPCLWITWTKGGKAPFGDVIYAGD